MKLHLHIDRLVLPAGADHDPTRLAAAVQAALADMLQKPGSTLSVEPGARPDAPPITAKPNTPIPRSIAAAVLTTIQGPAK